MRIKALTDFMIRGVGDFKSGREYELDAMYESYLTNLAVVLYEEAVEPLDIPEVEEPQYEGEF